jgi:hypothetical protein
MKTQVKIGKDRRRFSPALAIAAAAFCAIVWGAFVFLILAL